MNDILIIGVAILLALPSLLQILAAVGHQRDRFVGNVATHVKTQIFSGRVWLPLSCLGAMILLPLSLAAGHPAVIAAVLCICGGQLINWLTPPTLMLLGVSGTNCNELLPVLIPGTFPLKTIHLLRENFDEPRRGYDLKLHTMFTTSRTRGSIAWENVVSIYLRMCQGVLVDLRQHSGNLRVELSMIAQMEVKSKVYYLVDAKTPAPDFLAAHAAGWQVCTNVNDAIMRLKVL
jgi:hypothetical protein